MDYIKEVAKASTACKLDHATHIYTTLRKFPDLRYTPHCSKLVAVDLAMIMYTCICGQYMYMLVKVDLVSLPH